MNDFEYGINDHQKQDGIVHYSHTHVERYRQIQSVVGLPDYQVHVNETEGEEQTIP